jgi:hypothetical protein
VASRFTKRLAFVGISILGVALLAVAAAWPSTRPSLIRCRVVIFGSQLTYGPLAYDDSRWAKVLDGVASGDPSWLHVAADLEPALDTHPGEEMIEAVSRAFDRNPVGALTILLPRYGEGIVCAHDEEGGFISPDRAHKRMNMLERLSPNAVDGLAFQRCTAALTVALGSSTQSR